MLSRPSVTSRKNASRSTPEVGRALPVSRFCDRRRRRARARAEWALHHHTIDPAAALEANGGQQRRAGKTQGPMQADRAVVAAVADDRDHLSITQCRAPLD